ncbi:phage tail assembly chaperone [Paenirhodobacter sp.]|uniref:phage tail assembly chaperone n=1 Tax=Paenirhodobacter sp. TaxID=1965326 RepID=UPI003B509567
MRALEDQLCGVLRDQLQGKTRRPPEAGSLLWTAFLDLSERRVIGMAGPQPIQFSEIEAYAKLMCLPLAPRHVQIILALDAVWLDRANTRNKNPEGVKTLPHVSEHPISAALLDMAFG